MQLFEFLKFVLIAVLLAVTGVLPACGGRDQDRVDEAVHGGSEEVSFHSKRSLGSTLALFVDSLSFIPQAFQGKGAQVYIFS